MALLFRSWGWIDPAKNPLQGSGDRMRVSVLAGWRLGSALWWVYICAEDNILSNIGNTYE